MLGMVDGNGHPYSWSAIINGSYDAGDGRLRLPRHPAVSGAEPKENLGIPGAKVTHVWCDDPADAAKVARAVGIANIAERAEDVIGQVDAAIIATDRGWEHVDRARPFIEAGVPLFIDKPLCDSEDHLRQFVAWQQQGTPAAIDQLHAICARIPRRQGTDGRRSGPGTADHHGDVQELGTLRHSRAGRRLSAVVAGRLAVGRQHGHGERQHRPVRHRAAVAHRADPVGSC